MNAELFSVKDSASCEASSISYGTALRNIDSEEFHEYVSVDEILPKDNLATSHNESLETTMTESISPAVSKSKLPIAVCIIVIVLTAAISIVSIICSAFTLSRDLTQQEPILGMTRNNPGASCTVIHLLYPHLPSGLYWIRPTADLPQQVYCNMTFTCGKQAGGWRRLVRLDFTDRNVACPKGLKERADTGVRSCGRESLHKACVSTKFPANGLPYSQVCGRIIAFQFGAPDAFGYFGRGMDETIDSNYVDGVSITYGESPRKHLWTFAAAVSETESNPEASCECINNNTESARFVPPFVDHYSCETGNHNIIDLILFGDDPLWDGRGCGKNNSCCSTQPMWFHRDLPLPLTEDIEMRVCLDEDTEVEDIALLEVTMYVA